LNRALRATTGNALRMHWVRCGGCANGGTVAIHQDTPTEIRRQLRFLASPESSESRPSRNSQSRAARRRRQGPQARPRPGRSGAKSIDDAEHGANQLSIRKLIYRDLTRRFTRSVTQICVFEGGGQRGRPNAPIAHVSCQRRGARAGASTPDSVTRATTIADRARPLLRPIRAPLSLAKRRALRPPRRC